MSPSTPNWDDLRYFLAAARAGTLAGAARAMHVDHTTIGRRLSSLEHAIGAPVAIRGPEGLTLTPLGEALLPLVEQVDRDVSAVVAAASERRPRVRLAVPSGFTALFSPYLADLARGEPPLSVELVSGARPVDLAAGEADLAVRIGTIRDEELVARKVCESGWALYATPEYVRRRGVPSGGTLAGHDVIGFDPSLARVPAAEWLEERTSGANVVMRTREVTDMLAAIATGAGLGALPCMLADVEPRLQRLTPEPIVVLNVWLVYRREAKLSREIQVVMNMAVDAMRDNADTIRGATP